MELRLMKGQIVKIVSNLYTVNCNGTFYDPEFGVFESNYEPDGEITHFMELYIEEIYKNKEINVKIPQDFKEAFEKDEAAYELFQNLSYPEKSKFIYGLSHLKNPKTRRKNIEKRLTDLRSKCGISSEGRATF